MSNKGFILKESLMRATESFSDKEFREVINTLFNYAVYYEEPEFTDSSSILTKVIFEMERPAIDNNNARWREKSSDNTTNDYTSMVREMAAQRGNKYAYSGMSKDNSQ